jgi:heat shock protein HtpX
MARSTSFGRDPGLQARMLLTLFLLGLLYAVLIGVLFAAGAGAVLISVLAGALFLIQFFTSDKIALYSMGAREVSPRQAPELHALIERLCIQANLPKPRVAIAETSMPNAFAVGRSPRTATVCATTGLLELLSPAELEGVMAHELTHVQNRDVMVMTIASFFASVASFIVQIGFWFGGAFGGDDDDNGPGFFVVILVSAVVYVISFVLIQALSRIPQQDLRQASGELAAFYIFPPKAKQSVANLFSTHPPLEKRIAALQRLEAQLQGTA